MLAASADCNNGTLNISKFNLSSINGLISNVHDTIYNSNGDIDEDEDPSYNHSHWLDRGEDSDLERENIS